MLPSTTSNKPTQAHQFKQNAVKILPSGLTAELMMPQVIIIFSMYTAQTAILIVISMLSPTISQSLDGSVVVVILFVLVKVIT